VRFCPGGCRIRWTCHFCVSALEEALGCFGRPEIFNTDQGSQFTSAVFTGVLVAAGIKISMDGRGRRMNNVFIERLWRSLKHEDIYLRGYTDGREAKDGIRSCMEFYNARRLHQALGYRTPMAVWLEGATATRGVDMMDNAAALSIISTATAADDALGGVIQAMTSGRGFN
jgi:putative transposase